MNLFWAANTGQEIPNGIFFDVSGVFDDGWCSPRLAFRVAANQPFAVCEMELWLQMALDRTASEFSIEVNDRRRFDFRLPHGKKIALQFACPSKTGEVSKVVMTCDNLMANAGEDVRSLSFMLSDVGCR